MSSRQPGRRGSESTPDLPRSRLGPGSNSGGCAGPPTRRTHRAPNRIGSDVMVVLETVLISVGLTCIAVLLVSCAVALVRDRRAELAGRRRLTAIIQQVRRDIAAERGE